MILPTISSGPLWERRLAATRALSFPAERKPAEVVAPASPAA